MLYSWKNKFSKKDSSIYFEANVEIQKDNLYFYDTTLNFDEYALYNLNFSPFKQDLIFNYKESYYAEFFKSIKFTPVVDNPNQTSYSIDTNIPVYPELDGTTVKYRLNCDIDCNSFGYFFIYDKKTGKKLIRILTKIDNGFIIKDEIFIGYSRSYEITFKKTYILFSNRDKNFIKNIYLQPCNPLSECDYNFTNLDKYKYKASDTIIMNPIDGKFPINVLIISSDQGRIIIIDEEGNEIFNKITYIEYGTDFAIAEIIYLPSVGTYFVFFNSVKK